MTLEITESLMLEHTAWNLAVLEELRVLGVRLALDDFGTGYSALTHLRRLPIDTIKMDRSFLDGIDARDGEATVRAIVELARVHGMEVVAEGIETDATRDLVRVGRLPPWPGLPLRPPRTARCRAAVAACRDPVAPSRRVLPPLTVDRLDPGRSRRRNPTAEQHAAVRRLGTPFPRIRVPGSSRPAPSPRRPSARRSAGVAREGGGRMSKTRTEARSRGRAVATVVSAALLLASLSTIDASAATAPTFTAAGSARQVYVTGLAPLDADGARRTAPGTVVATQTASSLGGAAVPRRCARQPATACAGCPTARSRRPLTVHSEAAAQWNPSIYDQSIPSSGYGYLTTRDGTKLAYSVHPPTTPTSLGIPTLAPLPNLPASLPFAPPYPTLIEYSGYGYANPAGPDERHRGPREPDGLRRRRREHARHRLLGRRVRLLRAAAEHRRLRRRSRRSPASRG